MTATFARSASHVRSESRWMVWAWSGVIANVHSAAAEPRATEGPEGVAGLGQVEAEVGQRQQHDQPRLRDAEPTSARRLAHRDQGPEEGRREHEGEDEVEGEVPAHERVGERVGRPDAAGPGRGQQVVGLGRLELPAGEHRGAVGVRRALDAQQEGADLAEGDRGHQEQRGQPDRDQGNRLPVAGSRVLHAHRVFARVDAPYMVTSEGLKDAAGEPPPRPRDPAARGPGVPGPGGRAAVPARGRRDRGTPRHPAARRPGHRRGGAADGDRALHLPGLRDHRQRGPPGGRRRRRAVRWPRASTASGWPC